MKFAYLGKFTELETYPNLVLQAFKYKEQLFFSKHADIVVAVKDERLNAIIFHIDDYANFSENTKNDTILASFVFYERAPVESLFDAKEFGQAIPLNTSKNCYGNSGLLSCSIKDLLKSDRYIAQTTENEQDFIAKVTHREQNAVINLDTVIEDFLNLYEYNSKQVDV